MKAKKFLTAAVAGVTALSVAATAFAAEYPQVSGNNPFVYTGKDGKYAALTLHGINYEGSADFKKPDNDSEAYFNDWCAVGIIVTADGEESYYAAAGKEVSWDVTVKEGATKDDNKIVTTSSDNFYKFEGDTCTIKGIKLGADYKIEVVACAWVDTEEKKNYPYVEITQLKIDGAETDLEALATGDMIPVSIITAAALVGAAGMMLGRKKEEEA